MSEFENTVPPNEETSDLEPIEIAETINEPIADTAPKDSLSEPINIGNLLAIAKKHRRILVLFAAIVIVAIILTSVFSGNINGGKTLFIDDMLVFNEINVENHAIMYGVIDKNGEIVTDADFTYAALTGEGMIVAQEPPMGESAHASSLASYGIIDSNGKEITKFSYNDCGTEFSDGMLPMSEDGKWGFLDKEGKWVIEPKYDDALSFSDSVAGVKDAKSRKWGFVDSDGKWIIKPLFEEVGAFADGMAPAKLDGKWGYINTDGEWVIKNSYLDIDIFSDSVALAKDVNENWGVINEKGEWIIKPRFQEINRFSDGVAAAKKNGKWGYIDADGKWVIDNDYYDAGNFADGLAYAQKEKGGKYGYIDKDGDWKIEPKYDMAYDFAMELACVKDGARYGYINRRGKTKIDFVYKYALPFYSDGYAPVCKGDKKSSDNDEWFVIDTKGKAVFKDTFDGLTR